MTADGAVHGHLGGRRDRSGGDTGAYWSPLGLKDIWAKANSPQHGRIAERVAHLATGKMVDKAMTVKRDKVGPAFGRIDADALVEIERCLAVFLGIAK